jgi:hypothetical protein
MLFTSVMGEIMTAKENLIMDALRHAEDRLWSLDEVAKRGELILHEKGREVFALDGVPMLEFYPPLGTSDRDAEPGDVTLLFSLPYRKLYV